MMGVSITSCALMLVLLSDSSAIDYNVELNENFIKRYVDRHNFFRSRHNATPLIFNHRLKEECQWHANSFARYGVWQYRVPDAYGYNIYITKEHSNDYNLHPELPVDTWYHDGSEIYNYDREPANSDELSIKAKQFTQVVWRDTREIGVAVAKVEGLLLGVLGPARYYVVSYYLPGGNKIGKFKENVARPISVVVIPTEEPGVDVDVSLSDEVDEFRFKPKHFAIIGCIIAIILLYVVSCVCVVIYLRKKITAIRSEATGTKMSKWISEKSKPQKNPTQPCMPTFRELPNSIHFFNIPKS